MRHLLAAVALALALAGCAAAPAPPTSSPTNPSAADSVVVAAPSAVRIPRIGAESSLVPLGFDTAGGMAVPPVDEPGQASYFLDGNSGVIPGEDGPAVIGGHVSGVVDGRPVPGVFSRLAELVPGDEVWVDRYDAPPLRWTVTRVESHPKSAFPTESVWGDTDGPELRLVTCGGALETLGDGTRTYDSNIIVYAVPG